MTGHKHIVTFVLSTTLTAGAGTEQFVLNVVKNAPLDRFRISIVQTDFQDQARLESHYVADILKRTKVYNIRSSRRRLGRLEGASNYGTLAIKQLTTCVLNLVYRKVNGPVLDQVRKSDLIYLIRNDDLGYLKTDRRRSVVLGSTHCSTLTLSTERRGLANVRRLFRLLKYRHINGFHFTSAKWQREAVLHKKYDFVLPLGTDTELFHPMAHSERKPGRVRFLFVSRLEADKGVARLLDAWKRIKLDNAELHVAGTGSMVDVVKDNAEGNRIVYHGVPSNEELAALYRSCDIFVFPTHGEIYGLVVLEALASGLFVIVSEDLRGNFDEYERMGMLEYVRNEPAAISQRMLEIVTRLETIHANRERVYEHIVANNDWRSLSAALFLRFERILKEAA